MLYPCLHFQHWYWTASTLALNKYFASICRECLARLCWLHPLFMCFCRHRTCGTASAPTTRLALAALSRQGPPLETPWKVGLKALFVGSWPVGASWSFKFGRILLHFSIFYVKWSTMLDPVRLFEVAARHMFAFFLSHKDATSKRRCIYESTYIYIYICKYVSICIYIYVNILIYIYLCMCVYACVLECLYVHIYICIWILQVCCFVLLPKVGNSFRLAWCLQQTQRHAIWCTVFDRGDGWMFRLSSGRTVSWHSWRLQLGGGNRWSPMLKA